MKSNISTIEVQGDLGGEKIAMSFDANSLAHIMSVLTDLYSDPEMAVIREYSTNAKDSHIAAGISRPIEITTPNALSPYFKVQDFGLGLSKEDILNIYSRYGASTKRNTNDQTGMLGLGCKSALTYSNQFNLVGIKDGVKTSVVVSRSADGSGSMEIISEKPTDEGNGVTITIPARNTTTFIDKVNQFFSFWKKDEVIINGNPPIKRKYIEITPKIFLELEAKDDVIVMGGVAYPIQKRIAERKASNAWSKYRFVYFADMGEINFTPSREKLHFTQRTTNTIQKIESDVQQNLDMAISEYLDSSENHKTFIDRKLVIERYLSLNIKTYKGDPVPSAIPPGIHYYESHSRNKFQDKERERIGNVFWTNSNNYCFVKNFDFSQPLTNKQKFKIKKFFEKKLMAVVYFVKEDLPKHWFDHIPTFSWKEIEDFVVKTEKKEKSKTRVYNVVGQFGRFSKIANFDPKKNLLYYTSSQYNSDKRYDLHRFFPDCEIVSLPEPQVNKFKETYPRAMEITDFVEKEIAVAKNSITYVEKLSLKLSGYYEKRQLILALNPEKIDDPELKKVCLLKNQICNTNISQKQQMQYNRWRTVCSVEDFHRDVVNPITKYSLLDSGDVGNLEHVYAYINAAYQNIFKDKK